MTSCPHPFPSLPHPCRPVLHSTLPSHLRLLPSCPGLRVEGRLWLYDNGEVGFLWLCSSSITGGGAAGGFAEPLEVYNPGGFADQVGDMVLVDYLRLDSDTAALL